MITEESGIMKRTLLLSGVVLILLLLSPVFMATTTVNASDALNPEDFKEEYWSKTIDFLDYAREYASTHGKEPPPEDWRANLHLVYINTSGIQLLYAGLVNLTTEKFVLTIPIQSFMEHYKSKEDGKDVVVSSAFIMLLAYNETEDSIFSDSPDKEDNLWASFSLGYDMSMLFPNSTGPMIHSKATPIPLTFSTDKLNWKWGMRYTNLTAIWWRIYITPEKPGYEKIPVALTLYDELTFTYNLKIDPSSGNATLTTNYTIGKMTDLWRIGFVRLLPRIIHFNSTGCYLKWKKLSDETIYQALQRERISMSMVLFQNSVILNHTTYTQAGGQNVTDNEIIISDSVVSTYADDEEKIFETNFGSKKTYKLYNYTKDPTETYYDVYDTVTRTCKVKGFAQNSIFHIHTTLLKLVPLVLVHMDPPLYEEAKSGLLEIERANYLSVTSYPVYSGFRIEHDPIFTAYVWSPPEETETPEGPQEPTKPSLPTGLTVGLVVIVAVVVAVVGVAVFLRRRPKASS